MDTSPQNTAPHAIGEKPAAKPTVVRFGFDVLDRVELAVAMVKQRLKRSVAAGSLGDNGIRGLEDSRVRPAARHEAHGIPRQGQNTSLRHDRRRADRGGDSRPPAS
jgi:hypothetical protein